MNPVTFLTTPGTRVKHVNTEDLGELLGFDDEGLAKVAFDVDPPDWVDHLEPGSLIEVDG